jgi:hypothetical protein
MEDDPALVYYDSADRPGTHVLLIGIADYPWLEGGSSYEPLRHEANARGMGQLTAPANSMRRMADWFLDRFNNQDRQLASLSLLLSEAQPELYTHTRAFPRDLPQPSGTIEDVSNAVTQWLERANLRRDNGLVFAFCGHGVHSGNPVLLCRDFGKNTQNPFRGAIDFEQFRIALSTRQPDTQLLLVDACRTPDLEAALLGEASPGDALLAVESLSSRDEAPAWQSVHFATSLFTQAWGRKSGASLFTEALIRALNGGAAEVSANWWVTTSRLHTVLSTYLQRISAQEGVLQRPVALTEDFLITMPGPIEVDLYVSSEQPDVWREPLTVRALRGNQTALEVEHSPPATGLQVNPEPLRMTLTNPSQKAADVIYSIHAQFRPSSQFEDCLDQIIAYPPEVSCRLPVRKRS